MLSREDIEKIRIGYIQTRDRCIGNVNLMQGAVDGMDALLALCDQKNQAALAAVKKAEPVYEEVKKEKLNGRLES